MRLSLPLAVLLFLAAGPALAQRRAQTTGGPLEVKVLATGTVVPRETFRIRSAFDGRIEGVQTSSNSWAKGEQVLGLLVQKDLAALMDSNATTSDRSLEERWHRIYRPAPVQCGERCFVLKVFMRQKAWVNADALLVEAARGLRLVGGVRPGDIPWVKDGQTLLLWPRSDPSRKISVRVERFSREGKGERTQGVFSTELDERAWLEPGTEWDGHVLVRLKRQAVRVPTAAVQRRGAETFLTLRVSTGVTTYEETEVFGVPEGMTVLILGEDAPTPLPHAPAVPAEEPRRERDRTISPPPEPEVRDEEPREPEEPSRAPRRRRAPTVVPIGLESGGPEDVEFPSDLQDEP